MEQKYEPHDIIWTAEKISRFWDYLAHNQAYENTFFSKIVGNAVINLASRYSKLKGNILDYGCAHGFLIEKLLKHGVFCEGLEFSADSAKKVQDKFQNKINFKGVTLAQSLPTPLEDEKYEVVFAIEMIEHLLPSWLYPTVTELYRIIKKGGIIIITVPNDENLEAKKVICAECGCIFHPVQHVSSWTQMTLNALMNKAGFYKVICRPMRLREEGNFSYLRHIIMQLAHWITGRKKPHLVYIGRK